MDSGLQKNHVLWASWEITESVFFLCGCFHIPFASVWLMRQFSESKQILLSKYLHQANKKRQNAQRIFSKQSSNLNIQAAR
jgi:hypothetical protein